jgi:hypothetical protein
MLQRHATDVISLVSGTIFAGVTAVWLLEITDVIELDEAWMAGPVILIIAGVLGLIVALRPSRPATQSSSWVGGAAPTPYDVAPRSTTADSDTTVSDGVEPTPDTKE